MVPSASTAAAAPHRPPLAPEFVDDTPATPAPQAHEACRSCGGALPDRDPVNFCPFCGVDLRIVSCMECGETLEPGWRYCPSCGTEAPA